MPPAQPKPRIWNTRLETQFGLPHASSLASPRWKLRGPQNSPSSGRPRPWSCLLEKLLRRQFHTWLPKRHRAILCMLAQVILFRTQQNTDPYATRLYGLNSDIWATGQLTASNREITPIEAGLQERRTWRRGYVKMVSDIQVRVKMWYFLCTIICVRNTD